MTRAAVAFLAVFAATAQAQQSARLRALAERNDTAALATEVRQHPADARELLGTFIQQAGRARPATADSMLKLSQRLASAYAAVWEDSFPVTHVARFARMSAERRAAKVGADSVRLAGNAALGSKGVDAAIALWRDAVRRSMAIDDTAGMAAAMGNIGSGYYRASELDSAEAYLTRARRLAEAVGDRRTMVNALGTLGSVAKERGNLPGAQEAYTTALELRARIGDVRGTSADHNNLGLISAELGDVFDARSHYMEALRVAREHQLDEAAATALLNLGNLASVDGDFGEASTQYREALALDRKLESHADVALVLHNLGLLELRRGDYRAARSYLVDALRLFMRAGTAEDLVQVRRDIASVDAGMGDMRSALDQLRRAEQQLARIPRSYDVAAAVALARADVAMQLNTMVEADRQFARAQALYRRAGDASGEAEAQQGRALLLMERKQFARAQAQLATVMRSQLTAGDRRSAAITRLLLAHVYDRQGDTTAARQAITQALDTLRAVGDLVGEAAGLQMLGDLELDAGLPVAAESRYRQGLARIQSVGASTLSWQLHAGLGRALRARGAVSQAEQELRLAIGDVERMATALTVAERRSAFLADKWEPYAQLALLQQERGDVASAFSTTERMRGRQMLELLSRGRVRSAAAGDSTLVTRAQDLRTRISQLTEELEPRVASRSSLRGPDLLDRTAGVTREALVRAQSQYEQVLLEMRDVSGGVGAIVRSQTAEWRDVAARLNARQVFLEYLVTDSTTLVFVISPDTARLLDLNVDRATLVTLVDFARGTLGLPASASQAWRVPLRSLHATLIAPIEESGLLASARELVIVPHAELHYLPFAALVRRDARQHDEFLVERYDIGYAPSASTWLRLGERTAVTNANVLALAPRADALPGSRAEVDAIRALYGSDATVITNGSATEQLFRASAANYGVVHLATYGVLNRHNPLFSFVELSRNGAYDGRLEVHEVFGLSLHARLLVLSACQTALASGAVADVPAGDDWVGLVRAFLGAGAENVIATLWAVEDRSTARVMEGLHRRLRAGASEVGALSEAQRETLRNPGTSGPFYWAGFVLVGGAR